MTPPIIVIGAPRIMMQVISTSCCTCWTSFVVRVMSDGAPNWFTSREENESTLSKTAARVSRPKAIASRAPKKAAPICAKTWMSEMPSM